MTYRVFIIEDDMKIAELLKKKLEQYGYAVQYALQFRHIATECKTYDPHIILLDINLPYYDGFYWCRQIRMQSSVPIIFLSARSGEMDQVMAIENGGDDYLTKPIQLDLLLAKVKGIIRRTYGEYAYGANEEKEQRYVLGWQTEEMTASTGEVQVYGLKLLLERNELHWKGHSASLTQNEMLLAAALIKEHGLVVSRDALLEALWDDVSFVDDNTLTVNVTRLRKKLDDLGLPKVIETIRGSGYKLVIAEQRS